MLSSENPPPDLPCSSQISPLKAITSCCDERNPLPNFSIRGYVSSSRAKDIKNNWPFSQKNLQLCLKYGVKDVLPPFEESLNSVSELATLSEIPSYSDSKLQNEAEKCRLTSETMAADPKVCPVCKTFSSSSNTTLNAHIDQCLSEDSTTSKVIKRRIKPRKTRLMADIYKTSLHCTLEDLDRRNGTTWASNLGFPGQDLEACTPVNVNEDINEDGDYVCSDSNKTKVRVLSKLGDSPSLSKKFASLTKKLLSVKHASVSGSKKKMRRKHLDFKKRGPRRMSGSEVEVVETLRENEAKMEYSKDNILETQKERGGFADAGKIGDIPDPSPESDSHGGGGKNVDSYNVETRDEFVSEPTYEVGDGEAFAAFNRSLNSAFLGPTGTNIGECFSTPYNEDILVTHSNLDVGEVDADDVQGNYYVDVDPIQIPGPPGSFLPSPGRMGSEELQGISSLTTCRIQSSEDEREVIDMGSLDSPISAISVLSNSFAPVSKQSHFQQTLPEKNEQNSEAKFTSKSTSNPVLRLMGKNLVVANKEENPSPQNRLSPPHTLSGHPPSVPENMPTQYFDNWNLSDGFHVPSTFRPPPFPCKSFGGSFSSSLEFREHAKEHNLIGKNPLGSNMRLGIQTAAYDDNIQVVRNHISHLNSVDSLGRKLKEIIIIDDYSPERHERGLAVEATHTERTINNPFYGYDQAQGYPISSAGSRVIQSRNTRMLFPRE